MENTIIRVTKAQKLTAILNNLPENFSVTFHGDSEKGKQDYVFNHTEAVSFLEKELELLSKKNSGEKKLTADQKQNEIYKEDIVNFLAGLPEEAKGVTCTEIFKRVPSMSDYSPQKVASLCRQLRDAGRVVSYTEKGKTLFALA